MIAVGFDVETAQRQAIIRSDSPEIVAARLGLQRVFDARNGLPAAAVAELKRATRLALSPHDERHAVLAYWVPEPTVEDARAERFGAIVIVRSRGLPLPDVSTADLSDHQRWQQHIKTHLATGMQVRVELSAGPIRVWFDKFQFTFGHQRLPYKRLIVRAGPGVL